MDALKGKINSAKGALEYIKDGMCVGLGSGTTVQEFIKLLSEKVKSDNLKITCVPTSFNSRIFAIEMGLLVTDTDAIKEIDVAIDGADKITRNGLLKGGGGALTREKIVGYNAKTFIIIADESKIEKDGILRGTVTMEVLPFAAPLVMKTLEKYNPRLRTGKGKLGPIVSDNGNFLVEFEAEIHNPKEMELYLKNIPGVLENGIFTKFDRIIIGTEEGHYIFY